MAQLPVPEQLDMEATDISIRWPIWKKKWGHYYAATELEKKNGSTQVSILLTILGESAQKIYENFTFDKEDEKKDITNILKKFNEYVEPQINQIFERCMFYRRYQQEHESFDRYVNDIKTMSKRCDFTNITVDKIIRDKIINGIRNNNLRKSLITRSNITCEMLIKICRAEDISQEQSTTLKTKETINYINSKPKKQYQEKRKEIKCRYCGGIHQFKKELCPAYGKTCAKCNRMNHYRSMCKASEKNERVQNVFSVYKVNDVRTVDTLPKCETVTLKTQWGSLIKFQIDNGASVNVIPLSVYELASKDFQHRKIKKSDTTEITAFGGTRWKIKGEVIIRVQRRNKECLIRLKIADGYQFHSILGRSASVELGCIKILDNDEKYEQVNQIQNTLDLKILMTKYPEVFDGKVGKLEGKYTIKINEKAVPVKHAQRTVSVPLRERVRQKLKELEKNKIIQKVNEPSEWISSMVVKIKKSGDIRICLDPKDLNKEICREHYPLPVIEEIETRLSNAKVFSIFDVKNGFWQVELDTKSSMLTTFNTPFGRYRWNRLPFGISSAPEVFQRKMHEISEGLDGVEVEKYKPKQ